MDEKKNDDERLNEADVTTADRLDDRVSEAELAEPDDNGDTE